MLDFHVSHPTSISTVTDFEWRRKNRMELRVSITRPMKRNKKRNMVLTNRKMSPRRWQSQAQSRLRDTDCRSSPPLFAPILFRFPFYRPSTSRATAQTDSASRPLAHDPLEAEFAGVVLRPLFAKVAVVHHHRLRGSLKR